MTMAADTIDDALAGRKAHFSWRALAAGKPPEPSELRRFIQIAPVVDFNALEPGRAAIDAIRQTADGLNLAGDYQARVRVTGLVPINDDQFATLSEHAALNGGRRSSPSSSSCGWRCGRGGSSPPPSSACCAGWR